MGSDHDCSGVVTCLSEEAIPNKTLLNTIVYLISPLSSYYHCYVYVFGRSEVQTF
jgi:hypothetical protein